MKLQPVVEGRAELQAVPVLFRRLLAEARASGVEIGKPIRCNRSDLVSEAGVKRAVKLALIQPECHAIVILFDADDDCPRELAPKVESWAQAAGGRIPCCVILARREYEAWFLGALDSLRGTRGIRSNAQSHEHPEEPRGAKELLEQSMEDGVTYSPTADQPALTAKFSLRETYRRCRSFRKLVSSLDSLLRGLGCSSSPLPPSEWGEGATC